MKGFEVEDKINNERLNFYKQQDDIQKRLRERYKEINVELKNASAEERIQAKQQALEEANAKTKLARLESERKIRKLILEDVQKLNRAEAAAELARGLFAAQPIPDPTPFSRTTPEQTKTKPPMSKLCATPRRKRGLKTKTFLRWSVKPSSGSSSQKR